MTLLSSGYREAAVGTADPWGVALPVRESDSVLEWVLVGVGVVFLVATLIIMASNDAPLRYVLLQASLPVLLALAVAYAGVLARRRYATAELRRLARFTFLGIGALLALTAWFEVNDRLAPGPTLGTGVVILTAMVTGAGGGLTIGWLILRRDQQQRRLRETTTRLQAVLDTVEAAILIKDTDGRYELMNDACKELAGLDPDTDVEGLTDEDIFPPEFAERFRKDDQTVIETGETIRREEHVPSPDGERVQLTLKAPLRDADDNIRGVCAVSTEITERIQRERELEARVAAMEASIDGMAILDEEGRYTWVNQSHANIYGYEDPEAFHGESWELCYSEDERARFEKEVLPQLEAEGDWRGEAVGVRSDGTTFPQELSLTTLDDGGMVCVVRNISERKAYEEELERQNERLEDFAEIVSHDLRNPLAVAEGNLELLREEQESEQLDQIAKALSRIDELIEDVLSLARGGRPLGETEVVSVEDVATRSWSVVAAPEASIEVASDCRIQADRSRLRQLFENLFRNGIEHAGSDVCLTVGAMEDGFYVADDGPGIDPSERGAVFDQGYSTRDGGTGFGLSIVEEIARAHGWDVQVIESEAGGARFEITGVDRLDSA